jgi:hypothetical protein
MRDLIGHTFEELDAVLQQAGLPNLTDLRGEGFNEEEIQNLLTCAGLEVTVAGRRSHLDDSTS